MIREEQITCARSLRPTIASFGCLRLHAAQEMTQVPWSTEQKEAFVRMQ